MTEGTQRAALRALAEALGSDQLTEGAACAPFGRDAWVLSELDELEGAIRPSPLCAVHPRDVAGVAAVVNVCRDAGLPLVPVGLRSGVCGGVLASAPSVVLDLSRLARVRAVEPVDQVAWFDAGVRGSDAESHVSALGFTLGHYPQSMALSSVGGWVATRAAGQFSTAYGCIEDRLVDVEAVLPSGQVLSTRQSPRAASGVDLRQLLLGSEGTLGVITGVGLALSRKPEARALAAYHCPSMNVGLSAQREVLQSGFRPPVLRQYDPPEVARLFPSHQRDGACLLLVVHEGPSARVAVEREEVARLVQGLGCTAADASAVEHWLEARNHVPQFKFFLEKGIVVDTIEVAAPWSKIDALYQDAVGRLCGMAGILNASAHSSHAYEDGVNLYFSFAVKPQAPAQLRAAYWEAWGCVMEATLAHGGIIAHHHGIGRVRRAYLRRALGEVGYSVLTALKRSLDPTGFMNPGVLLESAPDTPA